HAGHPCGLSCMDLRRKARPERALDKIGALLFAERVVHLERAQEPVVMLPRQEVGHLRRSLRYLDSLHRIRLDDALLGAPRKEVPQLAAVRVAADPANLLPHEVAFTLQRRDVLDHRPRRQPACKNTPACPFTRARWSGAYTPPSLPETPPRPL